MRRVTTVPRRRILLSWAMVAAAVVVSSAHYVVGPGDTLSAIAQREGTTAGELAAVNGLTDLDLIRIGDRLALPSGATTTAAVSHSTHTVASGETIASIAADHGVSVAQIEGANGIVDRRIYAGTTLRLSGEGLVATDGGYELHRISGEDTLIHVASHHDTTAHALAHANGLAEEAVVPAGTDLKIPARWRCPVAGARFFNDWGFPRSGGRSHTGTDLFAPRGTAVVAPVSGRVEQVTGRVGGHQFVLRGDDGNVYLGSHMDGFEASGRVSAGTVVGYVGDSGNAEGTDPHLHFEIHAGGVRSVNPYPSLMRNGC